MILMAINNLFDKCNNREEKTTLKYKVEQKDPPPKDFDWWKQRAAFAEKQIKLVKQYMSDFQEIIYRFKEEQEKKSKGWQNR